MLKRAAGAAARAARAMATAVGLAVVLAMVLGASSAALAGNLDPLKVGSLKNVATKTTALVGKVAAGEAFVVKNPSGGSALGLQVNAGQAPLTVNPEAGKATNLDADKLDGKDSAQFAQLGGFKATEVLDVTGALPRTGSFTSNGGTLLISAAGSGFRSGVNTTSDDGIIGMRVLVDGQFRDNVGTYTNGVDSHKTFVNDHLVVSNLAAGAHTIKLEALHLDQICGTEGESNFDACTTTDGGDNFSVSVLEIPK